MSFNLSNAFEAIIKFQGRSVTIERGATTASVRMASSNYFKSLPGIEESEIEGREYVVSKRALDAVSFPTPQRGDVIVDSVMGANSIIEVKEMVIFGALIGFRVRTG